MIAILLACTVKTILFKKKKPVALLDDSSSETTDRSAD